MSTSKRIKSALISVFDKTGLEPIINRLNELGVTIYSTGGTQSFIEGLGVAVERVEDLTSYPSILGGRVKTLHPKVFGGILNRRDHSGDQGQIAEFEIPEIDEISQSQIAKVLSDLDAKIELNNKINTELEAMAKLIYDYWFVQFDFPNEDGLPYKSSGGNMVWNEELKREIPEGWEVKELSKVLSIKYGKDHKKLNNGIIPVYGSGGVMRYVDEYLYNDETILIPRKGSIGNLFYVNEPFWSVDTMFYTKASKKGSVLYYFYQLSIRLFIINRVNGISIYSLR
jgi:hypothetical protein